MNARSGPMDRDDDAEMMNDGRMLRGHTMGVPR